MRINYGTLLHLIYVDNANSVITDIGVKLTVLIMNALWYLDETDTWVLFSQSSSQ